jgi:hypothetical protein
MVGRSEGIASGSKVDDHGIGVSSDERAHAIVEHLGPQRGLAHHAGLHTQPGEVVVDR